MKVLPWIRCLVYIDLTIPKHTCFQIALVLTCVYMVPKIKNGIRSYVHANNKPLIHPCLHQKQLSFNIILGIMALLPLDYVQRSLSRCDRILKSTHVEVERLVLTYDYEWNWFCSVLCRYLCSFLKIWLINIQKNGEFFISHT